MVNMPTGRTRYTTYNRMFRDPLIILQVEIRVQGFEYDGQSSGHNVDYTYWRNATLADISTNISTNITPS